MCDQLTTLARYDQTHQMLQCAHGTVHLVWQLCSLRLHPRDVLALDATLTSIVPTMPHTRYEGALVIMVAPDGRVMLWLGGVGLSLTPAEFTLLRNLLTQATCHLRQQYAASAAAGYPAHPEYPTERTVRYTAPFSTAFN